MTEKRCAVDDPHAREHRGWARFARPGLLFATVAGLATAVWTIDTTGLAAITGIVRRMGIDGFVVYCLYSLLVFGLVGGAWLVASGGTVRRLFLFAWARLLREAAADLLPFSQIGGIVVGTRVLTARGMSGVLVYASLIADLTTEMASQLLFTLFGVGIAASMLLDDPQAASLRLALFCGVLLIVAIVALAGSVPRWFPRVGHAIAARFLPRSIGTMDAVATRLAALQAQRARMGLSFVVNLAAWIASAAGAWLVLRLMTVEFSFWKTLSLESLIFALRSVAFMIPGGIGVQEAGYVLVAPLFGLPPESAIALALAKRLRDLAIGLPALLVWQVLEARALVGGSTKA